MGAQIGLDPKAMNVPRPQIVQQAIKWADQESGKGRFPHIDASRVYMCGHSAGIVTVRPCSVPRVAWCLAQSSA